MVRIVLILIVVVIIVLGAHFITTTACLDKIKGIFIYKYKRKEDFHKLENMYHCDKEIFEHIKWIQCRILKDKKLDKYERSVIDNCIVFIENLPQTLSADKMKPAVLKSLSQCKKLLSEYDEANMIALKQSFGLLPEDDTVEVELPQNVTNALEYFEYIEQNNTTEKESIAKED